MTKYPIIVSLCLDCRREVYGDVTECPVCGTSNLVREAT